MAVPAGIWKLSRELPDSDQSNTRSVITWFNPHRSPRRVLPLIRPPFALLAVLLSECCAFAAATPLPKREMSTLPGFELRPVMRPARLDKEDVVTLDGRLDEAVWSRAI